MSTHRDNQKQIKRRNNIFSMHQKFIPYQNRQEQEYNYGQNKNPLSKSMSIGYTPQLKKQPEFIEPNSIAQPLYFQRQNLKPIHQISNKQRKISHSPHSIKPSSFAVPQNQNSSFNDIEQQKRFQQYAKHIMSILKFNEQKLANLQNSFNHLKTSMFQLYDKHQQQLRQKVMLRCQQFTNIFKKTLQTVQKKTNYIKLVDQKINLYTNTMKETNEKLKLLKIKQDCLDSITKRTSTNVNRNANINQIQHNLNQVHTASKQVKLIKSPENKSFYQFQFQQQLPIFKQVQQINIPKKQQPLKQATIRNSMIQYQGSITNDRVSPQKITPNNFKDSTFNNIKHSNFQIKNESFFDFDKEQCSDDLHIVENLSPFQTNQIINGRKSCNEKYIEPINEVDRRSIPMKKNVKINVQSPQIQKIKSVISDLIKKQSLHNPFNGNKGNGNKSLQCYLDHMGYLRRPNGTYIYKSDKSMIMLTNEQFQQLIFQGLIDDSMFRIK